MSEEAAILSTGDVLPSRQEGFDAQNLEFSAVQSFDWLGDKLLPAVVQTTAVLAVLAASLYSAPAMLAASGAMLAFELGRAHMRNQADLNRELVLYHHDIARVLGKSPDSKLTLQDMYDAADEKSVGEHALKPLKMELDHLTFRGRYNFLMGAARAALTAAVGYTMSGMINQDILHALQTDFLGNLSSAGANLYYPITGSLGAMGLATMSMDQLGKQYFHQFEPLSIYSDLKRLEEGAKERIVSPEQVFDIIIKLDKGLAQEIETNLGKPYAKLTYHTKQRVIAAYENKAHPQALAQAINEGKVEVTAAALQGKHQLNMAEPLATRDAEPQNVIPQLAVAETLPSPHITEPISRRNAIAPQVALAY